MYDSDLQQVCMLDWAIENNAILVALHWKPFGAWMPLPCVTVNYSCDINKRGNQRQTDDCSRKLQNIWFKLRCQNCFRMCQLCFSWLKGWSKVQKGIRGSVRKEKERWSSIDVVGGERLRPRIIIGRNILKQS